MRRLYMTFDTEDFIGENSPWILHRVLERLRAHDFEALFFVTGHMAEKLQNFPVIVDMLSEHQIGYHSSSHSVHPTLFEFTDVEDYEQAYKTSLHRETSHIDPLTGEVEGSGGILALRRVFHRKQIRTFRAPGHCWTPPHSEAMRTLGLTCDFSASVSSTPVKFKGINFYPRPIMGHWQGSLSDYRVLLISIVRNRFSVMTLHPSSLVNKDEWDSIYLNTNPKKFVQPHSRSSCEVRQLLRSFDLLVKRIAELQKLGLVETKPVLEETGKKLVVTRFDVEKWYKQSMVWAFRHNYRPKYLLNHFFRFFELSD